MLVVLSWTCTQNKTIPVRMSWDCLEDQAPVTIEDPFSPRKKAKWNYPCGKNPNAVNVSASSPQTELVQCYAGSRIAGGRFTCLEIVCCFWWWEQRWSSGTGNTVPRPAALHWITKKMTLLKNNFCGTKVCVFTQSVLCASSGFNARLPLTCCC